MAAERKSRPLSDGMLSILRAMAAGKPVHSVWSTGRSYQGGLTTAMHALYKRGLITRGHKLTDAGRAAAGVKGLDPAKHTAAEIHGCEVTKWSNQQCVHGTYGCTATHGVPAAETQQEKKDA